MRRFDHWPNTILFGLCLDMVLRIGTNAFDPIMDKNTGMISIIINLGFCLLYYRAVYSVSMKWDYFRSRDQEIVENAESEYSLKDKIKLLAANGIAPPE